MIRRERALKLIDPSKQSGLEIGPLVSPIVTSDMGKISYVDHATTEELRQKYANDPNVDESRIVNISYVWGEQTLRDAIGPGVFFDYVIASHVIEHVPDMITWLNEIYEILKPGGVLSLMIPDKRFTFDIGRNCTITADLIDAHLRRLRKPSPRHIYDHFSNYVEVDASEIWAHGAAKKDIKKGDIDFALAAARQSIETGAYVDSHCWVFTPRTFFEQMRELVEIGLVHFEVGDFIDTQVNEFEFYVSLRKPIESSLNSENRKSEILASFPDLLETSPSI